jgi:predicted metal-dependent HD superfamily phosphohydrolase
MSAERRVRAAWDEARAGLGLGSDDAALDDLIARYREPHRRYHDLRHIAACLEELDRVRALATRPAEVATALLFHDAIYVPLARDNEARSAALAGECLARAGADPAATSRIRAAIEATRSHEAPEGGDAALVLDIDMSILAAPSATFDAYEDGVRREHATIDDASFARGRSAFVLALLERKRLFHVEALHRRWDAAARANLERSLRRWR